MGEGDGSINEQWLRLAPDLPPAPLAGHDSRPERSRRHRVSGTEAGPSLTGRRLMLHNPGGSPLRAPHLPRRRGLCPSPSGVAHDNLSLSGRRATGRCRNATFALAAEHGDVPSPIHCVFAIAPLQSRHGTALAGGVGQAAVGGAVSLGKNPLPPVGRFAYCSDESTATIIIARSTTRCPVHLSRASGPPDLLGRAELVPFAGQLGTGERVVNSPGRAAFGPRAAAPRRLSESARGEPSVVQLPGTGENLTCARLAHELSSWRTNGEARRSHCRDQLEPAPHRWPRSRASRVPAAPGAAGRRRCVLAPLAVAARRGAGDPGDRLGGP